MKLRILMFLIILPTMGLAAYYAEQLIAYDQSNSAVANRVAVQSVEKTRISDLIHELQKERGFSAGFIGSSGANFVAELRAQRDATDAQSAPALTQTQDIAARQAEVFASVEAAMRTLAQMRRQIDAQELSVPQMAAFYTSLINDLLVVAYPVATPQADTSLDALQAKQSLLGAAKEDAGLERAMGATGLGGGFTPAILGRFSELRGGQRTLLSQASIQLNDAAWDDRLYASPEYQALQTARDLIATGAAGGDFGGLTAPQWFEISTDWIEFLRTEERASAAQIFDLSQTLEAAAAERLRWNVLVGILSLVGVGILATACFEYIIRRVKKLTNIVDGFAQGDFERWVPGIERSDELSAMARAIYKFKQETLALRREAEAMKEAEEATLNAKHGRVVDLVTKGLDALARADLTIRFEDRLDDEYDQIRQDFNAATERLCAVLTMIVDTVQDLDQSSVVMNTSALDLAARTAEQVETIQTTTQQVSALSTDVEEFGEDVMSASSQAANAREMASKSADLMGEVVEAMGRIKGSSEEIGKIIAMIDDIAFQTNLLALNAGVEAARAGPAGRGFAVVASEVGNLAQRASQATLDIKSLVEESGGHVLAGVELVDRAGTSLDEISGKIAGVDDILGRVAEGARAQVAELKTLASSMILINDLTGKNTVVADETRAGSSDIADRSKQLGALIADFQLHDGPDGRLAA